MNIVSKLPNLETTIFTVMSGLANEHNAINLSQGFPNFDCDPLLIDRYCHYLKNGFNQYAPMAGVPVLRETLSTKIKNLYGGAYSAADEITITSGATQAIFSTIHAFVHAGDEVIIVEPAYDCYKPSIELAGGKVISYQLTAPDWGIDWEAFGQLISSKTKMIILNNPHNPCGSTFKEEDLIALEALLEGTDILLLSDEVYEHLVFDGQPHHSVLGRPKLRDRSLACFSFGKTLHATGWKMGYIVGAAPLMEEFRKVHQFDVFCSNAPVQYAIADYLQDASTYLNLNGFFQKKRDLFNTILEKSAFKVLPSAGTYFQLADFSAISDLSDVAFAKQLTEKHGVAVIPISVFYKDKLDNKVVRFCFAKTDDLLIEAGKRLQTLNSSTF